VGVPQNFNWVRYPSNTEGVVSVRQKTGKTGMLKLYSSYGNSRLTISQEDLNKPGKFNDYALRNDNYFLNASWKNSLGPKWTIASAASFTNVSIEACTNILAWTNSRLRLKIDGINDDDIVVARERVQDFKEWLDR